MASEKKAIRKLTTCTPMTAHSGAMTPMASTARHMKGKLGPFEGDPGLEDGIEGVACSESNQGEGRRKGEGRWKREEGSDRF